MTLRTTIPALLALCAGALCNQASAQDFAAVRSGQPQVHYTFAAVPEEINVYRRGSRSDLQARDLDQDGVVESATVVRTPGPGALPSGSLDRVTFVGPGNPNAVSPSPSGMMSDDRKSATGTIDRINIARVQGVDTLLVRVNTSINRPGTLVDLGPVTRWPSGTIRLRDVVSASGPTLDLGDRSVIVADRAALNTNPEFEILRTGL